MNLFKKKEKGIKIPVKEQKTIDPSFIPVMKRNRTDIWNGILFLPISSFSDDSAVFLIVNDLISDDILHLVDELCSYIRRLFQDKYEEDWDEVLGRSELGTFYILSTLTIYDFVSVNTVESLQNRTKTMKVNKYLNTLLICLSYLMDDKELIEPKSNEITQLIKTYLSLNDELDKKDLDLEKWEEKRDKYRAEELIKKTFES